MRIILTLISLLLHLSMMAQTVSVDAARSKASSLFSGNAAFAKGIHAPAQPELAYTGEETGVVCFYVFNNPNGGFAIIGGDERAHDVIGYGTKGSFNIDAIPANMLDMLNGYKKEISSMIKSNATAAKSVTSATTRMSIEPLIKTEWGQQYPYNCEIPSLGGSYAPLITGCNATAAAQIMKYYEYAKGEGSNSYQKTWNTGSGGVITLTFQANFTGATYDFNNMLNNYNGSYTNDQAKAVGKLMYHAGVAMNMDYGQNGSASITQAPGIALAENFGYDKSIALLYQAYYATEDWENMMYGELKEGRPILYSGESNTGGHAFLIDGYKEEDNTFHVNWGWNGSNNGYFHLSGSKALDSGSANGQYNRDQAAIINIMPANGGSYSCTIAALSDVKMSETGNISQTVNELTINRGAGEDKELSVYTVIYNNGLFDASVEYSAALRNVVTGMVYYPSSSQGTAQLSTGAYYVEMDGKTPYYSKMKVNTSLAPSNGTYEVMPCYRPKGASGEGGWQLFGVDRSTTIPTITVINAGGGEKIDINFSINDTKVFTGKTVQISSPSSYTGTVTYTSSDESVATVSSTGEVTGIAPGTATIKVEGDATEFYNATSKEFTVTVTDKPKSYNPYLSVSERVSNGKRFFFLNNNGTEGIYITKLVIKDKNTYQVRGEFKVEDYDGFFGQLNAGQSSPEIYIGSTDAIVYNYYYTYNGESFIYCNDSNDPSYEPDEDTPTPPTPSTIDVTGITLSSTAKTVKVGETFTLTATVSPANATNKDVEWTTSDNSVASVDAQGKVSALSVGEATISVKAKDGSGVVATCKVTVNPDNTQLIAELTNIASGVKTAYNSLKNLSSDMDKYLEGRIKVGETKKYESLALQDIDAAYEAYMSKAENFINQLNNNHVATNEELEWFKKISDAFTKNEVLEYFKYYALEAEITAEGNGKVEFCGNVVRNETKKFVYYYPKAYTGVDMLCSGLGVASHNPMIFFKENACTSMDNSTYCFDVTQGMCDPETYDKDIQIPVEYDNEKIKVVFHDNTAIITELGNALNSAKSEYEKTANLSNDMEQFLDGCIRTSGMKAAENAALQDVKKAYETICKNVNDYIALLNDHHNATDNELKKYRALAKALSYEYILDFFKEYTLKATIKAEGNGKVEFCGEEVRNETKTFAFYYPKAYAGVESLCYSAGASCNNPINFFNEKAAVAQDDATYCFDVVKDNGTPVTYEKNTEIGISDPINIIVTFNDYSTGIRGINAYDEDVKVYDTSGRQVKAKRGINIVVDKNGNRRKVVIK